MRTTTRLITLAAALACSIPGTLASAQPSSSLPRDAQPDVDRINALSRAAQITLRIDQYQRDQILVDALRRELAFTVSGLWESFHEANAAIAANSKSSFEKITLNSSLAGFDVIRVTPPDTADAWDMNWQIILPGNSGLKAWYFQDLACESFVGFSVMKTIQNAEIDGLDLPEGNLSISQPHQGARLKPGHDYFIWLRFGNNRPTDAWLRVELTPTAPDSGS